MTMLQHAITQGDEAFKVGRSVRLRSSASAYFSRTQSTPTDEKKFTQSVWLKRGKLGVYQAVIGGRDNATGQTPLYFTSGDQIGWGESDGVSTYYSGTTTAVFRDPSAWYHIVTVYDSNNATAADRLIIYVNGVRQTITVSGSGSSIPSGRAGYWNQSGTSVLLGATNTVGDFFDGLITEIHNIDGQALTPSSFGETDAVTGVWKPKKYAGTYGTNGFYLNFSDNSAATAAAIGKDSSGNGNNWTPNNISLAGGSTYDSMLDVPTMYDDGGNGRGNYCTLNPFSSFGSAYHLLTAANLNWQTNTSPGGSAYNGSGCTFGGIPSSGLWYHEWTVNSCNISNTGYVYFQVSGVYIWWTYSGTYQIVGSNGTTSIGALIPGDVVRVAVNSTTGKVWFGKNGGWFTTSGTPDPVAGTGATHTFTPSNDPVYWSIQGRTGSAIQDLSFNFGQRPFSYTPPTGFKSLNTQNLPDSTIKKGKSYFDVSLFTGAGSAQTITNSGGFQPDLVWQKGRGEVASNRLVDSVRGVDKVIYSNLANAETTEDGVVDSFNSNGFTGGGANVVTSGYAGVGWQWKAGGAAVTNNAGTIPAQVSANPTAGFSIVTYTGTGVAGTIGHGLGVAPKMIISKSRNNANADSGFWDVYHANLTSASNYLKLNTTDSQLSASTVWNSTAPTSTVYSVGSASGTNAGSSATYVAYCFAEVAGFSKFGSYTGNGSADGPFVYCGFKPRFVMAKRTDSADGWFMLDSARDLYNASKNALDASSSGAEFATADRLDFLSNGFKLKASAAGPNVSGGTYIFAAFAENPFKNSLAR